MTGFIFGAALAVLLALALLLRPFLRGSRAAPALSQRQLNAAIYREQAARLDQDLADDAISAADHAQARTELQRRVLQDTAQEDAVPTLHAPKKTVAVIAVLLPVAAFGLYFLIGNPASMNPAAVSAAVSAGNSAQDVERMVAGLAAKLQKDPSNLQGWAMLARSYKVMGRALEAEQAYDRAGAFLDTDAQLLADYADVAAANADGNFAGKPARLLERALKADPQNAMALWLSGTAAMGAGQFDKAVAIWAGLLKLLPPDSEDARMLQSAIAEVRGRDGKGPAPAPAPTAVAAAPTGASVSGTVELAAALKSKMAPDDTVMVIARVPGSRMPVAVMRVRGAQLPMKFTLDDSLAMSPQSLISTAAEVEVEARISRSGQAKAEAGDLISPVQTIKVGARGVTLNVAQVRN